MLHSLSEQLGWPASMLCIDGIAGSILLPSKSILLDEDGNNDNNGAATTTKTVHQHPPLTAKIHPRHSAIRGGKGGFGTLLKGQSKQAGAKTTLDFGACRDLSGRRLRHVNDEIKLRKWRELQQKRERGEEVDELAALQTQSGIRNWHLMVPSWSDGASFTKKGRRKHERQLEREVRSFQSQEERARRQKEEKKMEQEWAVMEYVRRGEVESARVVGSDGVKDDILAHMKKRKLEKMKKEKVGIQKTNTAASLVSSDVSNQTELEPLAVNDNVGNSPASSLITLSGEITVFDLSESEQPTTTEISKVKHQVRIQSESEFATVGIPFDAGKLKEVANQGIYIEYTLKTAGLSQIGFIRVQTPTGNNDDCETFRPNSDTGDGVGDDNASFGYDGSRKLKFHGGKEMEYGRLKNSEDNIEMLGWSAGDVLSSWCKRSTDAKSIEIGYALNGKDIGVAFSVKAEADECFFPALSLNLGEVVGINLGPDFSHNVKEECVGLSALKKDTIEDGSSKPIAAPDDEAPPKKRPREEKNETKRSAESSITTETDKFNLNDCTSLQQLQELGADRLKNILLSMGIKCGGTLEQRAERLFSLKGLRREEYPQKVRGKNFIL